MLRDLFYNRNGRLMPIGPDTAAEEARWDAIVACFLCRGGIGQSDGPAVPKRRGEHCRGCPCASKTAGGLLSRLNGWIGSSHLAAEETDAVFKKKSDADLGAALHRRNNTLPPECRIDRITLISWRNASRDPARRPNDQRSRENLYKLCYLIGLKSKRAIREFFTVVAGAEAFTRVNEFECCIEHFVEAQAPEWLRSAAEAAALVLQTSCAEPPDHDEDEISIASAIGNSELTADEFASVLASCARMKADVHEACAAVEGLSRSVWLRINSKKPYELPEGWTVKNKKIIAPLLTQQIGAEPAVRDLKSGMPRDLAAIGASRNFPNARILNLILSGKANEEMIRRSLILLLFADVFMDPSRNAPGDIANGFAAQCSAGLDVNDGYDALILFCCCTADPMAALRRRLHGGT